MFMGTITQVQRFKKIPPLQSSYFTRDPITLKLDFLYGVLSHSQFPKAEQIH